MRSGKQERWRTAVANILNEITLKDPTLNDICDRKNKCTVDIRGGSDVAGRTEGVVTEGRTDLDHRSWWRSTVEGDIRWVNGCDERGLSNAQLKRMTTVG